MSSADIRGMFAGLPGAHGIIEAALNGQGLVMTDDSARPSSAAPSTNNCPPYISAARPPMIYRVDFHQGSDLISSSSAANRRKNWCGAH